MNHNSSNLRRLNHNSNANCHSHSSYLPKIQQSQLFQQTSSYVSAPAPMYGMVHQQQPTFTVQQPQVICYQVPVTMLYPSPLVGMSIPQPSQVSLPTQQHQPLLITNNQRNESLDGHGSKADQKSKRLTITDPNTNKEIKEIPPPKDQKNAEEQAKEQTKSRANKAFRAQVQQRFGESNNNQLVNPMTIINIEQSYKQEIEIKPLEDEKLNELSRNSPFKNDIQGCVMVDCNQFVGSLNGIINYDTDEMHKIRNNVETYNIPCPLTEDQIEELGLKKGSPTPPKPLKEREKKFIHDAQTGEFKPSWCPSHSNDTNSPEVRGTADWREKTSQSMGTEKRGDNFYASRSNYHGRNSEGRSSRKPYPNQYGGRTSLDKRYRKPGQIDASPPECNYRQQTPQAEDQQNQPSLDKEITATPQHSTIAKKVWKPRRKAEADADPETLKYEKLCKEVRGLLNKITPSTYDELAVEFCNYKIYEDEKLMMMVINLIFDKAVDEPKFCPLYSDLCKKQMDAQMEILTTTHKKENINLAMKTFLRGIVSKSQQTFSEYSVADAKINALKEENMAAGLSDQECLLLDEEMRSKEKRRLLGIIRFIAQLFRLQILTHEIINNCLVLLMGYYQKYKDEAYVEYSIELLETVGCVYEERMLKETGLQRANKAKPPPSQTKVSFSAVASKESTKDRQKEDDNMKWLKELCLPKLFTYLHAVKETVTNRIRFKIMNLDELSNNKWVPRGGQTGPKTIDEVREEAEKEKQQNEAERLKYEHQKELEWEGRYRDHRDRDHCQRQPFRDHRDNRQSYRPSKPIYQGRNSLPDSRRSATPSSSNSTVSGQTLEIKNRYNTKLGAVDTEGLSKPAWGQKPVQAQDSRNWRDNKMDQAIADIKPKLLRRGDKEEGGDKEAENPGPSGH